MPLSLLLKLIVTLAPAGTVMVFMLKAIFWAIRSIVTLVGAGADVGVVVSVEVGAAVDVVPGAGVVDEVEEEEQAARAAAATIVSRTISNFLVSELFIKYPSI